MVAENLIPIPRYKALLSTVEQVQVGAFKVVQKEGGNSAKAVEGPLGRSVSTSHIILTREARLQVINPASEKLDCKRVSMTSRIITGDAFESSEVCSFCHLLFAFHITQQILCCSRDSLNICQGEGNMKKVFALSLLFASNIFAQNSFPTTSTVPNDNAAKMQNIASTNFTSDSMREYYGVVFKQLVQQAVRMAGVTNPDSKTPLEVPGVAVFASATSVRLAWYVNKTADSHVQSMSRIVPFSRIIAIDHADPVADAGINSNNSTNMLIIHYEGPSGVEFAFCPAGLELPPGESVKYLHDLIITKYLEWLARK